MKQGRKLTAIWAVVVGLWLGTFPALALADTCAERAAAIRAGTSNSIDDPDCSKGGVIGAIVNWGVAAGTGTAVVTAILGGMGVPGLGPAVSGAGGTTVPGPGTGPGGTGGFSGGPPPGYPTTTTIISGPEAREILRNSGLLGPDGNLVPGWENMPIKPIPRAEPGGASYPVDPVTMRPTGPIDPATGKPVPDWVETRTVTGIQGVAIDNNGNVVLVGTQTTTDWQRVPPASPPATGMPPATGGPGVTTAPPATAPPATGVPPASPPATGMPPPTTVAPPPPTTVAPPAPTTVAPPPPTTVAPPPPTTVAPPPPTTVAPPPTTVAPPPPTTVTPPPTTVAPPPETAAPPSSTDVRNPTTPEAVEASLTRPGTTVIDPQGSGYVTPGGELRPPPGANLPTELSLFQGGKVEINGGQVSVNNGGDTLAAQLAVTPEGRLAVSQATTTIDVPILGPTTANITSIANKQLRDLNDKIARAGLRVTKVTADGGKITIVTGPR